MPVPYPKIPSDPPKTQLEEKIRLAELMLIYWNRNVIGTLELRNWLGEVFPEFQLARRQDVDDMIEQMGDEQANPLSVPMNDPGEVDYEDES